MDRRNFMLGIGTLPFLGIKGAFAANQMKIGSKLGEFLSWDYGMLSIAQEKGREAAYETALRIVFSFWDRNGDNLISRTEHRQSLNTDFGRADTDNNAVLSRDEFTSGFSVMVALKAAINPAPVQ